MADRKEGSLVVCLRNAGRPDALRKRFNVGGTGERCVCPIGKEEEKSTIRSYIYNPPRSYLLVTAKSEGKEQEREKEGIGGGRSKVDGRGVGCCLVASWP